MYKKYLPAALFFFVISCLFITRLFRLDTLPSGMHIDEAGMAYDAWCLSEYGVDRYLKSWPVYLNNFGSGQSSLYAFLCAALFKIFGCNIWTVRLPAVIFSFLTCLFGMKITREIYPENKYLPLATGILTVICPYFILAGRFGLDCNLMLGMSTVFLYFFICALCKQETKYYIISGITGGLVLYTYALSYIILPLFLLLCLVYTIWCRRFLLKKWVIMAIPMGILAFPLILVQIVNAFDLPEMKLGIFTITKMTDWRASEISLLSLDRILHTLTSIFKGDDLTYNSIPQFFNLYIITIPLFLLGLFSIIKKCAAGIKARRLSLCCFPLLWFVSVLFLGGHITAGVNHMNSIFCAVILIAVEGISFILQLKKKSLRIPILSLLSVIYLFCFLQFGNYYYRGAYTRQYHPLSYFDITVSQAVDLLNENNHFGQDGTYMAEQKIYYALSAFESPYEMSFSLSEDANNYNGYYFNALGAIEDNYNYIVRDIYFEYADQLRARGFTEIAYPGYYLFYKENKPNAER